MLVLFKSKVPVPEITEFWIPKKVRVALPVVAVSAMSKAPFTVKLLANWEVAVPPPKNILCIIVGNEPALKVPPVATVILPFTVSVAVKVLVKVKTPEAPWPTVKSKHVGAIRSILTVWPSAIITLSVAVGIVPEDQVVVWLQLPDAIDVILPGGSVACVPVK